MDKGKAPASTPFPVPSFGGATGDASPEEFLIFLRTLISKYLDESCPRIPVTNKETWVAIIIGLTDHFLVSFPSPNVVAGWDTMREKVIIVEATLGVIGRVFDRVDRIFVENGDLVRKIFVRLLGLAKVLDLWSEVEDPVDKENFTPLHMQNKVLQTLNGMLRGLGNNRTYASDRGTRLQEQPAWKILRIVLIECLDICQDLSSSNTPASFPVNVMPFETPRLQVLKEDELFESVQSSPFGITIDSSTEVPGFLAIVVEVMISIVCHPLLSGSLITDIVRKVAEMAQFLFEYFLSSRCSCTSPRRAKALMRIVSSVTPLQQWPFFQEPVAHLPYRLLKHRMFQGPKLGWEIVDSKLASVFMSETLLPLSRSDIFATLTALRTETWGGDGKKLKELAVSYLRACVPRMDGDLLQIMRDQIPFINLEPEHILNDEVDQHFNLTHSIEASKRSDSLATDRLETFDWQAKLRALVEDIVAPDEITWMEEGEASNIVARALEQIYDRFKRPLLNSSADYRIQFSGKFARLPCLLFQCDGSDCVAVAKRRNVSLLRSCFPVISHLLEGNEGEVSVDVRRGVFMASKNIITHHSMTNEGGLLDQLRNVLFRGIADKERIVRLGAGRALSALVQGFGHRVNEGYKQTEYLFDQLYQQIEVMPLRYRESLVLIVGSIGRTTNHKILGQVLCFLVAQLAKQNVYVKACAATQIVEVAKHHKKSPYAIITPHMDRVAPFLVSNLIKHPALLHETCRVVLYSPVDFLTLNLPHTLPQLFADCKLSILEALGKELSTPPAKLLILHAHSILARVFLLPRASDTNKALKFMVKVLTDANSVDAVIEIESVVKSCTIPLLTELVIAMGDESSDQKAVAVEALKKVQQLIGSSTYNKRALSLSQDSDSFLKTHMLGLISYLNELLQDVHGKKPVDKKRQIIRSLGALVSEIGPGVTNVAPQIMATLQTMVCIPELSDVTLESWYTFLTTLGKDAGPHIGPTSATFIAIWPDFSPIARELAIKSLKFIIFDIGEDLGRYADDVVDLSVVPELQQAYQRIKAICGSSTPDEKLRRLLGRCSSENLTVAVQALEELKMFMLVEHPELLQDLASGDMFDSLIGQTLAALFTAACRDGDGTEHLRLLAFECIGILGAVDPDRCEIIFRDPSMIVLHNFADEEESMQFAMHLICDLLVGAYRSTSDIKYQNHLAFGIQELMKFCQFSPALVNAGNGSVPLKVRNRWNSLPKHVLETVSPLLEGRFTLHQLQSTSYELPIYSSQSTYREWIQIWTGHLIAKASGQIAQSIFGVFQMAIRHKDVVVAHHLLPHLVLNILTSGEEEHTEAIRSELLVVLQDQIDVNSNSTRDKKLLSAQAVFMLLDHLNKWVREARQHLASKKSESKRSRASHNSSNPLNEQLLRVDSVLSSIDENLMAKAALQCKAFARSLMSFERQIVTIQQRSPSHLDLPEYYERLHEIYAHLDEPDGMEGVSTLILSPSLEHQIRQHESTGRWTAAQSCWEVRLQQSPYNIDFHLGLLRCLRNLGHYDTLRTHVRGVLTRNPEWESVLSGFQVESAWMVGAWEDVQNMVQRSDAQTSQMVMARLLLALRSGDSNKVSEMTGAARSVLGAPITAAGVKGYRRAYDSVLDLHLTHELEKIHNVISSFPLDSQSASTQRRRHMLADLSRTLAARLNATLPNFRSREPILSMRRTAFALSPAPQNNLVGEIGRSWLASAKIARKARQWQTAYSATLQAQQSKTRVSFMESAKLTKATDEPLRALQELETSMKFLGLLDEDANVLDLTSDGETDKLRAKAHLLRARWMAESDRFEVMSIHAVFTKATELQPSWESAHFYLGQFNDGIFKNLSHGDQISRGMKINLQTVRSYAKAIRFGSKYVYQTVPRLLTIWLDMGENKDCAGSDVFKKLNQIVATAIKDAPVYKWFTAFPQIVSRVGHSNPDVYKHLSKLIVRVMEEYPNQALWLFTSVVKSTKPNREQRGRMILEQLQSNPHESRGMLQKLISQSVAMMNELLNLCDYPINGDKLTLSMSKNFPRLAGLGRSELIIPLQESLTASLPPTSSSASAHQPFPIDAPTFHKFEDEIIVMPSLAKPRRITIVGSDGQTYRFLGKPKDDLRKDARLMDFNSIINKLLKANSESRRRQLRIRTYGVVTLNEECGFIQWVPHTVAVRPVLLKSYEARRIRSWSAEMNQTFAKIKEIGDKKAAELFLENILPLFPPVFHEWFIETFPEPTAWLTSRLNYGRTAAVMSMVGFILGLGDRHCENILLDENTGDVVHVDFNCLFEKGKTLETPERVPFRLTQNIVDGLGVTGVEGVFRIACEVTMQLLRDNKDSLMSVLDAFIHDPLVEWEDEKRKLEREPSRRHQDKKNHVKASVDLRMLAKNALNQIERKLKGIYSTSKERQDRQEKQISTSNLVQMLIQEATDPANLAKMYAGWAPWH